jgi:DNA-binding PucR family transcriptional regulator
MRAGVASRSPPGDGDLVTIVDGSILGSAAISAPEVMTKLVAPILERFTDMNANELQMLFDTFRVWQQRGSVREAANLRFCHPNTVRYRLHRIEQRTGQSLSQPRVVAEQRLVREVDRRLT